MALVIGVNPLIRHYLVTFHQINRGYISFMRIKIKPADKIDLEDISDIIKYENVAVLVDKEGFLKNIKNARQTLGITTLIAYNNVKKWLSERPKQRTALTIRIGLIEQEFHRGDSFDDIIRYALLAGKVTDNECAVSAYCGIYPPNNEVDEPLVGLSYPMVAIFVSPETKLEEIKKLLMTKVKVLFKEEDEKRKVPTKESPTIREVRKWYWLKKEMTYTELVESLGPGFIYETVKKAVERYRIRLR
jgi:hypothetical protein